MSSKQHFKHILYTNDLVKNLPHRNRFCDLVENNNIKNAVQRGGNVTFMPLDILETWEEPRTPMGYSEKKHVLYMFGILSDGSKSMVIAENSDIYFDVKVEKIPFDNNDIIEKTPWKVYTDESRFDLTAEAFKNYLRVKFQENRLNYKSMIPIKGRDFKYFQTGERDWVRISFTNLFDRNKAIKLVGSLNYSTAGDDNGPVYGARQGFYLPKIIRENAFNAVGWNDIPAGRYKSTKLGDPNHLSPKCEYIFRINTADIKSTPEERVSKEILLTKDRVMIMTIDIETWRSKQGGEVPAPEDKDYCIFMICMTFHWKYTNNALAKFCLVDMPIQASDEIFYEETDLLKIAKDLYTDEGRSATEEFNSSHLGEYIDRVKSIHCDNNYVIECGSEKNLLLALCDIVGEMSPDITTAFNGANFDWALIRERINQIRSINTPNGKIIDGLTYMKNKFSAIPWWGSDKIGKEQSSPDILKTHFRSERVKISAEKTDEMRCVLNFPGIIDTDLMVICEKLYPRAEVKRGKSLNYYLANNKIPGKEDMPYKEMFRIYERARAWKRRDAEMNKGNISTFQDYIKRGGNGMSKGASIVDHENNIARIKVLPKTKTTAADIINMKNSIKQIEEIKRAISDGTIAPLSISANMDEILEATEYHTQESNEFKNEMMLVGKYCVVDAYRCQQLFTARTIIADNAEFANMSYATLYEAFYRANGIKVEQLVGNASVDKISNFNIKFSKLAPDAIRMKYPGAYVFNPIKGLNTRRPVVGLDFSSLYPSLEMAYNLSPDMVVEDEDEADLLRKKGYILLEVNFDAEVSEEDTIKFPSYRLGDIVHKRAWIVRHNGIIDPAVDKVTKGKDENGNWMERKNPLPGERMGILPFILKDLFAHRKVIKKTLIALNNLKEQMEIVIKDKNLPETNKDWHMLEDELFPDTGLDKSMKFDVEEIDFRRAAVDSKQKGRKVHMNTFYGVQGYNKSNIYKLVVAGAITTMGKYNIQMVAKFCRDNEYTLWYGDTDSVYISSPERIFVSVDAAFKNLSTFVESTISECELDTRHKKKFKLNPDQNGVSHAKLVFDSRKIRETTTKEAKEYFSAVLNEYKESHKKLLEVMKEAGGHTKPEVFATFRASNDELFTEFCKNMKIALFEKIVSIEETAADDKFAHADKELLSAEFAKECEFIAKEEYWTQMVQITRRDIDLFKDRVNNMLYEDNGTRYLNMAYEEVLFPVKMLGKKRYFGIPHLEGENFHPKMSEYFIRGLEHIKQGQTLLAKDISESFIQTVLSVRNEEDPFDIVKSEIKRINNERWPVNYFISRAKYKPEKRNIPVQKFVQRMKDLYDKYSNENGADYDPELAALYTPPDAGDPFEYVVVKKEQQYDLRGRKVPMGKGDCYEYTGVFIHSQNTTHPMEIDLEHYVNGALKGILARFVTYKDEFSVSEEEASHLSEKEVDEKSMKVASEWVNSYFIKISGKDKGKTRNTGAALQKLFRAKNKINSDAIKHDLITKYGKAGEMMSEITVEHFNPDENVKAGDNNRQMYEISNKNVELFMEEAEKRASTVPIYAKEYVEEVRKQDSAGTKSFYEMWKLWRPDKVGGVDSVFKQKMEKCTKEETDKLWKLRKIMPQYMHAVKKYDQSFNDVYESMRATIISNGGELNFEKNLLMYVNDLDSSVVEVITETRKLFDTIVEIKIEKNKLSSISAAMQEEKFRRIRCNNQAPKIDPNEKITVTAKFTDNDFE